MIPAGEARNSDPNDSFKSFPCDSEELGACNVAVEADLGLSGGGGSSARNPQKFRL